ncbi:SUMF1/EgtB/PvdO family nonheme iron enzyme [Spirosoma sp. HMF4905]|uniref:SUMF1/EgtB/PvdO family nonheme iron enzyme n=1 Tax=Spirosoma arboris TaxID=2682092 RepID=A0A7K1S7H7_9BACT|nr:SUMF1/EgtB/PvdO family nonheme iron enzyme [Spirosoma arboris]MVM29793.1 SUMF1/EgtB/PvdO family nonheme iron enzyme [Spirosoma arboris]
MKYSLIAVLLITVAGTPWWPGNSKLSENATAVGNINEPDMVTVHGGRFAMGGPENNNEKPIHTVTLSSFKLAKYETTLAQWQNVMGSNPSGRTDCMDCPVTAVGWDDIQTFITKLNTLSGKTYRACLQKPNGSMRQEGV